MSMEQVYKVQENGIPAVYRTDALVLLHLVLVHSRQFHRFHSLNGLSTFCTKGFSANEHTALGA